LKLSASVATALLILGIAGLPAAAAGPPRVAGCPVFPAFTGSRTAPSAANQSAWNQDVSKAPIDPRSGAYIRHILSLGGGRTIRPGFGGNGRYGIPYNVVGWHHRRARVRVTMYPDVSDFGRAPIPPAAKVQLNADRHVLVLQRRRCKLFEMFDAHRASGSRHRWKAGSTAKFALHSARLRHAGWTSADAAGLPMLPGLVRYGEVKRGRVRHAIRVTFAATRRAYIRPATHYASSRCGVTLPPMGLRLRLRPSYDLAGFRGQALVIARALKQYGMIVADNGPNWSITGAANPRWNDRKIHQLTTIPGRAFQVVKSQASPTVAPDC
jgi:hypothetical protein